MRDKVACDARVSPRRQRHPSLRIKAAFDDVVESALQWQQWLTLGNLDIRLRFRRTALGPFWTTLSFSLLAAALGSVYAHVLGEGVRTYLPYVVCGLFVWVFIAATLQETTDCFVNYAYILKQVYVPRMTIVYRVLWRNILLLAFNIPTVVAVLLLCQVQLTWSLPLTFVGFALLALNLLWVSTLLALAAARHPLVSRLVQAMLPLAMFVTPLIWRPLTPDLRGLAQMNPLYYAVDLVRGPLLGQTPHPWAWAAATCCAVAGSCLAFAAFAVTRRHLPYWI